MSEFINNHTQRKEKLKNALLQIHDGKPYEEVKETFAEVLREATVQEIAEIEEALIKEGLPVEDIQYLCDVHVAMFRESLDQQEVPEMTPGHPVYTFRAENELANLVLNESRHLLDKFKKDPSGQNRDDLLAGIEKLKEFNNHYERKENLLFPYLEKTGFTGPSSVMWGIHDDIRAAWKKIIRLLSEKSDFTEKEARGIDALFTPMENAMREMFYKEDRILFTNALERLTDADWLSIHAQEDEFGFSFTKRGSEWPQEDTTLVNANKKQDKKTLERTIPMNDFPLTTGDLTLSQIDLMLTTLPVDITFVDENDTVRYFSETADRIFKRAPAIIGRKVQNCHPPQSVDKVLEIVEDFKAKKRDTAEFWIQMGEKFIHIRYFAMRDAAGNYRGTLEVSQDVASIRKLEGEKRLLDG
jgi:DUF438 domain-containing protein